MKDELHDLLVKLDTQIDGVESYLKRIRDIGENPKLTIYGPNDEYDRKVSVNRLGTILRVEPTVSMDTDLYLLRKAVDKMRQVADSFDWSLVED